MTESKIELKKCLLWVDVETNGLQNKHRLLEIACILTDLNMEHRYGVFQTTCMPYDPQLNVSQEQIVNKLFADADDVVKEMHTANGLWLSLRKTGVLYTHAAEELLVEWIKDLSDAHGLEKPILAGSSVHFDRKILDREMPTLMTKVNYRNMDVSSIRRALEWWTGVEVVSENQNKAHRAAADIEYSLEEAKRIQETLQDLTVRLKAKEEVTEEEVPEDLVN